MHCSIIAVQADPSMTIPCHMIVRHVTVLQIPLAAMAGADASDSLSALIKEHLLVGATVIP